MIALCESPQVGIAELCRINPPQAPFQSQITEATGHKEAIAFPEGRSALVSALDAANISGDDEVLLPGYACHSIVQAVEARATPVFVDIEQNTYNIDVHDAAQKVTPNTEAIIPVHMYGYPCDMGAIVELKREYDLTVIEDAAHGLGTVITSNIVGKFSDYCFFSFRFSKELTVFKGGLLVGDDLGSTTSDQNQANRLAPVQLAAVQAADTLLERLPGPLYATVRKRVLDPLFESSSDELATTDPRPMTRWERASLAAQFEQLPERVQARRQRARRYRRKLPNGITQPPEGDSHSYFRYPIRVPAAVRDDIAQELRRQGVGCSTMYSYALGTESACPTAFSTSKEIINLPVHASVRISELEQIVNIFERIWRQYNP